MASTVAAAAGAERVPEPLIAISAPFPTSIRIYIRAWVMSFVTSIYFRILEWRNAQPRPTYTKNYGDVPGLRTEARIFIPKTYKAGDKPLPLLIDVHGGGFLVGAPVLDDKANSQFAHRHGFVVVSLPYRLSPTFKFPTHTHDVAAQMRAVIDDESLPVDKSRIAIIGYSAGGNLALSAVQLNNLHKEIKAVAGVYPAVDMAMDSQLKMKHRVPEPDGTADGLSSTASTFYFSYVPPGVNRRDPLLSPMYAPREKLPRSMFLAGCEHDMLCYEAKVLAEKHAAYQTGEQRITSDGAGWQKGAIRWELIKGERHGFDQIPARSPQVRERRRLRAEKLFADIATWLHEDAFA